MARSFFTIPAETSRRLQLAERSCGGALPKKTHMQDCIPLVVVTQRQP